MTSINDPVEKIVADAFDASGISYIHEAQKHLHGMRHSPCLDFYLPDYDIMIECKASHTERSNRQLADHRKVILIQSREAAEAFAAMLNKRNGF